MINTAIILTAGRGRRLKPLTNRTPKALLSLKGDFNVLDFIFHSLNEVGIKNITMVVGYRYTSIVKYVSSRYYLPKFSICYFFNKQFRDTNTAYSLWLSCSILQRGGLIINGDTLASSSSLKEVFDFEGTCIGVSRTNVDEEAVKVLVDHNKRVVAIGKNVNGIAEYVGIAKIEPEFASLMCKRLNHFHQIDQNLLNSLYYDDVINDLLKDHPVYAVDLTDETIIDVDTIEDLKRARQILSDHSGVFR